MPPWHAPRGTPIFPLPQEIKPIMSTLGRDLSDLQKMAYYVTWGQEGNQVSA